MTVSGIDGKAPFQPNASVEQQETTANWSGRAFRKLPKFLKTCCESIHRIFIKTINALLEALGFKKRIGAPSIPANVHDQPAQPILGPKVPSTPAPLVPGGIGKLDYIKEMELDPRNHGKIFSRDALRRLQGLPVGSALLRFSPDLNKFFISRTESKNGRVELVNYPVENIPLQTRMQQLGIIELVPKPALGIIQRTQTILEPQNIPVEAEVVDEQIKNLAAKKDSLTNDQKLKVLNHLKNHLKKNKKYYDSGRFANIMRTMNAAEHLISHQTEWLHFIERMRNKQVDKREIQKVILEKLKFVSHPGDNDLKPLLKEFPNAFIQGYFIAIEKGNVGNFLKNAFNGLDVCFEARAKSIQAWLEANTVEDTPLILDFDSKKDNHYQILSKILDPFKETQLRAYYNKHYKNSMSGVMRSGQLSPKIFFFSDTWLKLRKDLEAHEKFFKDYNTRQLFVEFLKAQLSLPLKLDHGVEGINEITTGNIGTLVDQWINISGVDPFNYEDKKAEIKILKVAKQPIKK